MVTWRPAPYPARLLALVAVGGIALAVVLGIAGHLEHPPGLNPVSRTISDYALSDRGGPVDAAMLSLALGSVALLLGLRDLQAPARGVVTGLLSVWAVGLICAAIVPTDPVDTPLSPTGQFHRYASVAAFVALPAAAVLLSHRLAADGRWHGLSAYLRWLAVVCGLGLLALLYVAFPGDRVMIGVVERLLVAAEVALIGLLAARLWGLVRRLPAPGAITVSDVALLTAVGAQAGTKGATSGSACSITWHRRSVLSNSPATLSKLSGLLTRGNPRYPSPGRNAPRWK